MQVAEAEGALRQMLTEAGVDTQRPDLRDTWSVFRSFATRPVDSESDGILVQGGVYEQRDGERFVFDFLRQVQLPDDDEFLQIHCEFEFEPTADLRKLGVFEEWWFADENGSLDDYFDDREASAPFQAVADRTPTRSEVFTDET